MKHPRGIEPRTALALSLAIAASLGLPAIARADVDPWAKRTTWVSVRAGYAKSTQSGAAGGNLGYGFGFNRFIRDGWALGAAVQYDVLGRFGDATQSEVPFTLELTRHFKWNTPLRTYLGAGGGTYYRKTYRTGDDRSVPHGGGFLSLGANTPVDGRHLLGLDSRVAFVGGEENRTNPVFGAEKSQSVHWSFKLSWSLVY